MTGQFNAADNKRSRGIASGLARNVHIGSFKIGKNEATGLWYLLINQQRLIGTEYPSQDHAISVLHGLFTGKGGSTAGMNAVIARMIARGTGVIDADATIGTATISGPTGMTAGEVRNFSVSFDGTATDATYVWSYSGAGDQYSSSPSFNTTTAASVQVTAGGIRTGTIQCIITSASSSDSPVTVQATLNITGIQQSGVASTGIPSAVGLLTNNQTIGSNIFDQLGITNILTVINTSVGVYFWTPYARDRFREAITYLAINGDSIDPSEATWTEINSTSNGFGLICNDSTLGTAWTNTLNSGPVTLVWSATSGAMTTVQVLLWSSIVTSSKSATVSSGTPDEDTPIEVIETSKTNELLVGGGRSPFEPRMWNGAAADTFGASSGVFPKLSGGNISSDRLQSGYYWSKWQVKMTTPANPMSTAYQWDEGVFPMAEAAQEGYNNWTEGTWKHITNGDSVTFKVYNAAPKNQRRVIFTTGSALTDAYTSIVRLTGDTDIKVVNGEGVSGNDHQLRIGIFNVGGRDGLLEWMDNNPMSSGIDAELWYNGSKDSDLTAASDSTTKIIFTRSDGNPMVADRTYELRYH